jgi:hypothetical protein
MNRRVVIIIPYLRYLGFGYELERYTCDGTTIGEHNFRRRTSFMMLSSNVW